MKAGNLNKRIPNRRPEVEPGLPRLPRASGSFTDASDHTERREAEKKEGRAVKGPEEARILMQGKYRTKFSWLLHC